MKNQIKIKQIFVMLIILLGLSINVTAQISKIKNPPFKPYTPKGRFKAVDATFLKNLNKLKSTKTKNIGQLYRDFELVDISSENQVTNQSQTNKKSNQKDGDWLCDTKTVSLEGSSTVLNIFNPNTELIYPGKITTLESIIDGSYTSPPNINSLRNNFNIGLNSSSVSNGNNLTTLINAQNKGDAENLIAVKSAKDQIVTNSFSEKVKFGGSPSFESSSIYSKSEFAVSAGLGVNVDAISLKVNASFGNRNSTEKNRIVSKYINHAYTMSLVSDYNTLLNIDNVPDNYCVVSDVLYGQIGYLEIESNDKIDSMFVKIDAAAGYGGVSGNSNFNLDDYMKEKQYSIKGKIYGGRGNFSLNNDIAGIEQLRLMVQGTDQQFKATDPVVPISYVLRNIKTGKIVKVITSTSYNINDCQYIPPPDPNEKEISASITPYKIVVKKADDIGGDLEIYGQIDMDDDIKETYHTDSWTKSVNKFIKVWQAETPQNLSPTDNNSYAFTGITPRIIKYKKSDMTGKKLRIRAILKENNNLFDDDKNESASMNYGDNNVYVKITDIDKAINGDKNSIDNSIFDITSINPTLIYQDISSSRNQTKFRIYYKVSKND